MTLRLNNIAEFEALQKRLKMPAGNPVISAIPAYEQKSSNKHRNVICEADKIKFKSKRERAHFLLLKAMQQTGEIRFFLRQVAFDLIGYYANGRIIRHFVDFGVCQNDGTFRWVEVKGRDLDKGKIKRLQTEEIYGIKIEVV